MAAAGPAKQSDLLPDVMTKNESYVIQPKNEYFVAWQHFVAIVYLIGISIGVYLPTFDSTSSALWFICYCGDLVNFIDMIVMFFVAYVDPKSGAIREDRRAIVQYRLKTSFIFDLLGLLPLELLALRFPGIGLWRNAALFHLNRSVRFYKTIQIFQAQEVDLTHSRMVAAFFKYVAVLVIVIQSAACVWFREACYGLHDFTDEFVKTPDYIYHNYTPMHCYHDSWVIEAINNINANMSIVMHSYVMSLYWTFATVTAVGYGDIVAATPVEMTVSFITMVVGITVFNALMMGGLTSMLTNADAKRTEYGDKLQVVKATLKELDVAEDLAGSVMTFYEYVWKERHGFLGDKNELYDLLPHSFQAEICYAINACALTKAPLFENTNEGFMRVLSTKIKQAVYLPRQIIIKQGDMGCEMYYIRVGSVEILGEDENSVVAVLNSGMVFGEINLVFSTPRTATARAATFCELLMLTREDFDAVVTHYPSVNESVVALAKARYREINEQKMKRAEKKSDPHYKARQARKTSFVPESRIRRYSFAPSDHDSEDRKKPQGVVMDTLELRRLEEKDEHNIREYIGLKKIHESSTPKQTMIALITAIKSVFAFMGTYFMPFWKGLMIMVSVATAIFFPYVACFYYSDYQLPGYHPDTDTGKFWLTVTYLLDLCFVIHMLMLSQADFREYCAKNRSLTKTTKKLLKEYILGREYLQSWNFRLNVISIVPLELFAIMQHDHPVEEWRMFGFLRLNRLVQFFLLMRHLKKLEDDIHVSIGKLRSMQMFVYIVIFTHWCACALFMVHCQGVDCSEPTWYSVFLDQYPGNLTMRNVTQDQKIIVSLYWAVATLTSTGYGEINAVSVYGMIVAVFSMLVGILMFGYAVALMAATLANADSARVRFQSRLFAVKLFMKEQHLSASLQHRIIRYLQLMWIKYKGVWMPGDQGLLDDCPAGLRYDIGLEEAHRTLTKVPLFMHTEDDFLRDIAIRCHSFYYFPGEDIMHAGDISNELYMVKRGYCAAWSMDMKRKLADLGPGSFFGDQALLFGDQNHFTVQADTYCDVLVLPTEEFQAVLELYPDMKEQFEMASEAKEQYNTIQQEVFDKYRIQLHDENQAHTGEEDEYTEHLETETQQDSVVGFGFGNQKKLYDSFISRSGFAGKLARFFLFRYALLPEGKLLHYKVHTVTAMSFILSLTVPMQIAFLHSQTALWFLHAVMDMLFLGNLYLNMHVGFYNSDAVLVTHPLCTAKNYMRKNFIWDLCSCFPLEVIVAARYGQLDNDILHVMALMRVNRLCNAIKVKLSFNYFESRMDKQTGVLREVEFAIFTVMFLNFSSCIVFLTACPPRALVGDKAGLILTDAGYHCFNDSWVVHEGIVHSDPLTLYVYSVYWATATVVSVGYGDIHAFNWMEMRMTIVLMTVGVLFFAYIVASIASSMANADSGRARFQDKLNGVRTLMKDHRVSRRVRNRVVNYYTYLWRRTHGVNPSTLLDGVPHALLSDITYALYSDTIYKISLFTHADHGFVKMLSRCMRPMYFLKGEFIVRKNDIGDEMYFIDRGEVEVCNAEGVKVFATIESGGAFGEVALLFSCRRTASVRAKTNVDVFCLAKKDLDRVLNLYPEIKKHVLEIGAERRKQASARPLRKREATQAQPQVEEQDKDTVVKKNLFFSSKDEGKTDKKKDEAKKKDVKKQDAKKEDAKKDVKKVDTKKKAARTEDAKKEDAKKKAARKEDARKEDAKKDDMKKEDAKKEDTKQKAARLEDAKKEDTRKEDAKKDDMKKEDSKKEDTKQKAARIEDAKKEDTRKEDAKKEVKKPIEKRKDSVETGGYVDTDSDERVYRKEEAPSKILKKKRPKTATKRKEKEMSPSPQSEKDTEVRASVSFKDDSRTEDEEQSKGTESEGLKGRRATRFLDESAADNDEEDDDVRPPQMSTDESSAEDPQTQARSWYTQSPDFYYGSDLEDEEEDENNTNNNRVQNVTNNNQMRNITSNNNRPKETIDPEDQGFIEFILDPTQIIEPDSVNYGRFRLFLEGSGCLLAWITIYQMCFFEFNSVLIAIVYICDVINIIDLYIRARVTYYDDHGILVKDHKLARKAYFKNPSGFFMDLSSVFPIELVCFAYEQPFRGNIWSVLRILRLLRVFHVLHFFHDWEVELSVNVLKVRLLKFTFITLFLTHLVSCIWFMLVCPLGRCGLQSKSWFSEMGHKVGHDKVSWYISSVYWTMATMTSTGYGDFHAYNLMERMFAIVVMLTGKLMFGFILGNIASTLANKEARMTNYRNTLSGILGRLADQEVPLHMRQHVVSYLDYTWIRNQGHDSTQLFNDAPQCLAAEILHEVAKPFFDSMTLFKDLEDACVRHMALHVHRVLYQEGDYIAHKDDLGDEVLFIFRGTVVVIEHDDKDVEHEIGLIGYGTIIGEVFLVQSMPRLLSLKAKERTDLLTIERSACLELLEHFPNSKEIFDSHAQEYFVEAGHMMELYI